MTELEKYFDRFGIQVRGGCSCAGTYGHFLLNVDFKLSKEITDMIDAGDLSLKLGWIRLSLHPTMTGEELNFIIEAIMQITENASAWSRDYSYNKQTNEYHHITFREKTENNFKEWFSLDI